MGHREGRARTSPLALVALALAGGCSSQQPPARIDAPASAHAVDAAAPADAGPVLRGPEVRSSAPTLSKPLREAEPAPAAPAAEPREMPAPGPLPVQEKAPRGQAPQPLAPVAAPLPGAPAPSPLVSFAGQSAGGFIPPDTDGAVGPSHYVQMVNVSLAVYSKTGTLAAGFPKLSNGLWSTWSGNANGAKAACAANNMGDGIVLYDRMADRWIVSQFAFAVSGGTPMAPFYQCAAVSTTGDPTGTYNLYVFGPYTTGSSTPSLNDYPKLAIWPDAYYVTYNMFANASTFAGSKVCAWDRTNMLAGTAAAEQCFQLSPAYGGLLPSDLDGRRPPPAGSPNIVTAFETVPSSVVQVWPFHVDWTTPANSTFPSTPATIPVNTITLVTCGANRQCIPQLGTTNKLDALGDRLMFRAAYRNLGGHESLVINHSADPGSGTSGVRWYELRNAAGQTMGSATPVLFQQGTFAPDTFAYRWMASAAQDQVGDMALGYSHSNPTAVTGSYPSIRYAARSWNAAAGAIDLSETVLQAGLGFQDSATAQASALPRWGDYTAMSVDPTDDCTFWYTNEYLPASASGTLAWRTQIGAFRLPNCPPKYAISAPPSAAAGTSISVTVTDQDATGVTLPSYVGPADFTSSDPQAVLPGSTAFTAGVVTVSVTLKTAGARTVTATDPHYPTQLTAVASVSVSPGPAVSYAISPPASATAGVALSATVTARDAYGNVATGYAGSANVTSDDAKATLPAPVTFAAGVATAPVTFKTVGPHTLTATDAGNASLTATGTVQVGPGPAASYAVSGLAPPVRAGSAASFAVAAFDAFGNAATDYAGTAMVTSSDAKAKLPANLTFSGGNASGSITFGTRGSQTVTVSDVSNTSVTGSAAVSVEAGLSSGCGCGSAPGGELAALLVAAFVFMRRRAVARRGSHAGP